MTSFKVESWIWYAATISMVIARIVARLLHFKSILRLQIEDFLMVLLTCLYTILIVFLNIDLKVSTNLIDPAHPVDLTPSEKSHRAWGSKTVLLVEQCMCAVQWGTKSCLLLLYWRLTRNLKQGLIVKGAALYVGLTYLVMEILYFGVWCRPFHEYWAVPTDNQQCSTALHHLITNLVFNLSSDILIMSIPLPLFLKGHLEVKRKLLLVFPFSLGLFTILCAILSKQLSFTHPYSSEWVFWYCREASTAMIVSNMPYSWALIRRVFNLRSFFGDSTAEDMQGGHPRELRGYSATASAGAATLQSQSQSRSSSRQHAAASGGKMSKFWRPHWHQERSYTDTSLREATGTAMDEQAENVVQKPTPASSSDSGGATTTTTTVPTRKTDWTLDRLYPLDDEEISLPDITRRRYEG